MVAANITVDGVSFNLCAKLKGSLEAVHVAEKRLEELKREREQASLGSVLPRGRRLSTIIEEEEKEDDEQSSSPTTPPPTPM